MKNFANDMIYDFIIIGAGPAGCFCALELRKRGYEVCLLEKNPRNERTVCGDGLSPACVKLLCDLKFPIELFLRSGATVIDELIYIKNHQRETKICPSPAWGLSRRITNNIIQDYIMSQGIGIFYETKIKQVTRRDDVFYVEGYRSKKIVVAIGANSGINLLGQEWHAQSKAIGMSATLASESKLSPCFIFDYDEGTSGTYGWLFKIEKNLWNAGLWLKENQSCIKTRFFNFMSNKVSRYLNADYNIVASPMAKKMGIKDGSCNGFIKLGENIYGIGDAALSCDDRNGEGILQAIKSAILLADSF